MDFHFSSFLLLIFYLFCLPANAQFFADDFSSGNLDQWSGDNDRFQITDGELQLVAPTQGESILWVNAPTSIQDSTRWEFLVRQEFGPSSNNLSRIILQSDASDFTGSFNGYYLQIGGFSGSEDALTLYRQDGSSRSIILEGTAGAVADPPSQARVVITRNQDGKWTLEADYAAGTNFQFEGEVIDSVYPAGNFFGIYCRYTTLRTEDFYFDDFLVSPLFVDRDPPILESARPLSATNVLVTFNEPLEASSAENVSNYTLDPDLGNPASAALNPGATEVLLTFGSEMVSEQSYTLRTSNIADLAGNPSSEQTASFRFVEIVDPNPGDFVVSEIFADPSPSQGLPDAEFLEIQNLTSNNLRLNGLTLSSGGTPVPFPDSLLGPDEFVILCDEEFATEFSAFGRVIPFDGFPSFSNSSDIVLIENDSLNFVSVLYDVSWYRDAQKANGGFSLELIDPSQNDVCAGNWIATRATIGGTPGAENTVLDEPIEQDPPVLLQVIPQDTRELIVRYDEVVQSGIADDPGSYQLTPSIPILEAFLQAGETEVLLMLDGDLQNSTEYNLTVAGGLTDCLGNVASEAQTQLFGIPEVPEPNDLVINEVLFEPQTGGEDFVELFNRSDKIIDLRGLVIQNKAKESGNTSQTITNSFLVFPGTFVVITDIPQDILDRYTVERPEWLVSNDLPTLDADEGNVTLLSAGVVIDSFDYTDDLHFPLLDNTRGVSLERLNTEIPTNESGNWHSASSPSGFATPTAVNSQEVATPTEPSDNFIQIPEPIFSPDNDGFQDVLLLNYEAGRPGFVLNVRVLDHYGHQVRFLLQNELLGTNGQFKWDGTNEDGEKARIGIYVIWSEIFDPDGNVQVQKESIVLAGRLD